MRKLIISICLAGAVVPAHAVQDTPATVRRSIEQAVERVEIDLRGVERSIEIALARAEVTLEGLAGLASLGSPGNLASLEALDALDAFDGLDAIDAFDAFDAFDARDDFDFEFEFDSGDVGFESPPAAWAPQDPADSLWRAAREALNANDAAGAARMYRRIRTERAFAESAYRPASYYWEAYARQRIGGSAELRSARQILQQLRRAHPNYENMLEVERLESRIDNDLARAGDSQAGSRVSASVSQATSSQCPDQEMRVAAVESLITMRAENAMPLLKQVMARKDDCNAPLREKAVFLISQKRTTEAEDLLLDAAKSDPSPKVREQAVFWLSQVNSEKAVDAIEEILRSATNDRKLTEQAVFALSQHRSPRATRLLRDMAVQQNATKDARKNAIFWLGQRRDPETGQFLRTLYSSLNDADLKEAAIFAISQRRDEGGIEFMIEIAMNEREPIEARKQALFWAGQQRSLPLNRLGELYTRMPNREMKEQIIFILSQRREPEALDRLFEIARTERDVELRKKAIFWIGQSSDPRAPRFIADLIGA